MQILCHRRNMVRRPSKAISSKGVPWSPEEDQILMNYIKLHGEGNWTTVAQKTGLERSGKSCRLRWRNYLRPDIKRGNISDEEEDLIIRLHKLIGNRWALIAGRLPGRTDNEIKNYWNTVLKKKKVVEPTPSEKDHFIQKSDISSTSISTQDVDDHVTINNEEVIIRSLVGCENNIIEGLDFTPTTTESNDPHNIGYDEDISKWDFLGDYSTLSDMINKFDFSKDFLVD